MRLAKRLREFIAALDRRTPRPSAPDELRISQESNDLRAQAVEQLQQIERGKLPESDRGRRG